MTNSEEPTNGPDGLSSMNPPSPFNQNHQHPTNCGSSSSSSGSAGNYHAAVDLNLKGGPGPAADGTFVGTPMSRVGPPTSYGSSSFTSSYSSSSSSSGSDVADSNSNHLISNGLNGASIEPQSVPGQVEPRQGPPQSQAILQLQLQLPFTQIIGEELEHKTEVSDGLLVLTNFRLFLQTKEVTYNLPLGLVESVEVRDIFYLHLSCKDARAIRCTFPNNEAALEMLKRIQAAVCPPKKVEDHFAFTFYKRTREVPLDVSAHLGLDLPPFPSPKERFDAEVKRMEFDFKGPWRISDENQDYELCGSYPTHIIVPSVMDKEKLKQVACFRSARRFPAVVWRHKGNGAVISRCSQPEVGWFGWRSGEDEELVQNIVLACADNRKSDVRAPPTPTTKKTFAEICASNENGSSNNSSNGGNLPSIGTCNSLSSMEVVPDPPHIKKLLILDARSYSTAVVNRARGGGCECLEYYTNCEIQFMNLANIHSIRKSFINVRQLCSLPPDQANNNWFSQLESCKWLQHMSGLMKAAVTVATAIEHEGRPVMVHCSDGWDRTPQIVALAEILLDPYYRSLEGFQVLIEREWLDFGHKFADRCGQGVGSEDTNERCPVFLQWLDCLHQLIKQFPTAFEFNLTFLVKLAQHTYSNLFGTFLCNTAKERHALNIHSITHSIWKFLRAPANYNKFRNHLYTNCDQVLWPCCEVRELKLWTQIYLGYDNPSSVLTEVINPSQESSPAPSVAADCESSDRMSNCKLEQSKTRWSSCENLHHPHEGQLQRRKSDPSLSDSVLGIDSEEVESRCLPHTEKMLTAASRDIDKNTAKLSESLEDSLGSPHNSSNFLTGEPDDNSENEDTEPNSEEKSEETVINMKYLKSIESSTDTLVAEHGILTESSSGGIHKFIMEVNNKTDQNQDEELEDEDIHCKKTENDGQTLDKDYDESVKLRDVVDPFSLKDLAQTMPDLEQIIANQQCEVCATSKKLLEDVTSNVPVNSNLKPISSSSTNPSNNTSNIASVQIQNQSTSTSVPIANYTNSTSGSGSKLSSYNTPMHSRTPSTGGPLPAEEPVIQNGSKTGTQLQEKWSLDNTTTLPGSNKPSSYDVDGFEPLHDEVQSRLNVIISGYRGKIDNLEKELQMYRNALMNQVCHTCTHHMVDRPDDAISVADSLCSMEHQSVGHESHSSEISWEAVDERDTRPPLWLPDFAVTKCMGCEATFWLGKRKHHCRSCGKIFCADCSENAITIPNEQLFTPVRVCTGCFNRLSSHNPNLGAVVNGVSSVPNPSPLANGNGYMNGSAYNNHHLDTTSSRTYHNGLHYHHGSGDGTVSEYTPSTSPRNGSLLHRRCSEELPHTRKPHQNWKCSQTPDVHVCNGGLKLKTKHVSNANSNDHPIVDGGVNNKTNGHSSYQ